MRKLLAMLLIMTMGTSFLVGCGSAKTDESVISTEEEISFTRGEWITGLASSLGMIEYTQEKAYFTDVDSNDEIFPYVQLATEWGLFEETGGAFEPEGKATREFVVATAVIAAETIEPSEGGLYLISALEGSGKTELMCQFVKICTEEVLVDYIGIVSYEESLRSSFIKAFPQANGTDFGNRYVEVLENMSTIKDKKVLLIIDNIDNSVDEKELELLCKLPITIFLTSNFQKNERVQNLSFKTDCTRCSMSYFPR